MTMDLWARLRIAVAVALPVVTIVAATWISSLVTTPPYPQRRGFAVEGVPPVDLASAQRAWPRGEGGPGEREILLGYVRNIAAATVPVRAGAPPASPAAPIDLGTLLAAADPARGERTAQACLACHTLVEGGPNRIGPNLHGVVGRPAASHPGFAYSAALSAVGGRWTYESLDRFLTSPGRAVAGTRMTFTGLHNPRDRANVIAYLARLSPGAAPFPPPRRAAGAATAP